jgi:hypothetical protein
MLDLFNKQYDLQTLKENIYAVSLRDILKTQKLTSEFCVKYILNTNYQLNKEDENITVKEVLELQPDINKKQLLFDTINYTSDDDSYEDFDSFANRHP